MTTTIKLPVEFDNLLDSILYAGAFSTYSWYDTHKEFPELGAHLVGIYVTEDYMKSSVRLLDERILAETIEGIIENRKPGWQDVLHGALNDDFDANSADTVLQTAVLGKVVWG